MKRLRGFTLAEVLITLAIIGVVAAISIPSVISNSQQQEFKTGLRKAVSVLNSAITMNMAIDGESPYDNADLWHYLQRHMSVMKSGVTPYYFNYRMDGGGGYSHHGGTNMAFYTTDGMRFEMDDGARYSIPLHESNQKICGASSQKGDGSTHTGADMSKGEYGDSCGGCGSYGLSNNPNNTTKPPCLIMVDVNGDRKPSPANVNCKNSECQKNNFYTYPSPDAKKLTDIFGIMITEDRAVPFGVAAQRAMYQAQAKK